MKVKYCISLLFLLLPKFAIGNNIATTPTLSALTTIAIAAIEKKIVVPKDAKVKITPQVIHSAQYIPACLGQIEARLASNREIKRNNTVKITCDSPELDYPWQLFLNVKVDVLFPVIVSKRLLGTGHIIGKTDVGIAYKEKSSLRGQQQVELSHVIGARLKRRLPANTPLFDNHFCLICEGDTVTITASTGNLKIKTQGTALNDGNLGDAIEISNRYTQKKINAYVSDVAQVTIRL
ncbi:flagellar basal body P-ring formation chaperone FlgA [uncultured Shewanella sp.]|uniref:flagellar basal body P-ring formation chaperone FlgA n=1 Tax=uncultured Shewanella sp. TaxID=173975 RepID=UPI002630BF4C|nr:flagellar basal body P-ring formation chaperone FlgA [uncultured Shewanella sp.]